MRNCICNINAHIHNIHANMLQSLVGKGLTASSWVKAVADVIDGKGGGSNVAAQASGTNVSKLSEALSIAREFAKMKLD